MTKLKFFKKNSIASEVKSILKHFRKLLHFRILQIALVLLLVVMVAPIIMFFFLRPKIQNDINYGVTFSKKFSEQMGMDWRETYIKILDDLQVKNLRLVAYWDDIESQRDVYNFDDIKWQVEEADKRGVNVILTMGRKVPRYPKCFEPEWWKSVPQEEVRNFELYDYLKMTTNELAGYKNIKMWQVENEPFFPFGECEFEIKKDVVAKEIQLVKSLDDRPILVQDSGEGGYWFPSYALGDYLGISTYRKIWYDFWGVFGGKFIYFQYPLAHWSYKIKADLVRVPYQRIIVTELQAEPWGPRINSELTEEKNHTMSKNDFLSTLSYAQKAGFRDLYLWGVEWWLWEKEVNNNSFYWDTAKALFAN